jgi:DNA-binding NtrC family response regulator
MSPDAPRELLHPALEDDGGVPLAQARLTDQQRLAVVLQGAALAAHLEHGGWYLPEGWETARLRGEAELTVGAVAPGRSAELPQVLLLDLLTKLFRSSGEDIAGRGEGRHAARRLLRLWRHFLAPSSPDQAVAEILEAAPFLWQPSCAAARAALVAEHRVVGASHLWVAGPGWNRRRLLACGADRRELAALLAGPAARDLWDGWQADDDPVALAGRGRHRQALACWRRRPPRKRSEVVLMARSFFALGLYSRAHETLKGQPTVEARLLRLRCLDELGKLDAADQAIRRLEKAQLSGAETLELAEMAVRLLARRGRHERGREWVAKAFQASAGASRRRAELLAAEAAWDLGDLETAGRHLEAARPALADPRLARRWHEVRGLLALGRRDGAAVIEHYSAVLRERRRLPRVAAGRHWSNLAYGRVLVGDLAGAERAVRHAQRLLSATESPARDTLGHYNLAEIRLRRGHLAGVVEALEASTAENRRTGNARGQVADLELQVRLELVQGRPEAALAHCAEAVELIAAAGVGERQVFDLFAARAYGWLRRPQRAAACLARVASEVVGELEPEERPAVWALAGRADRAASEAEGTPWAGLWSAHLAGLQPRPGVWEELRRLEPVRAARLVLDSETVRPRVVPPVWLRRAVASWRAVGADVFADRLERQSLSPWRAVERYLEGETEDRRSACELFAAAGCPDVRLTYVRGGGERLLVAGEGGEESCEVSRRGGRFILRAPFVDDVLRALFLLVARDVELPGGGEGEGKGRGAAPAAAGTIVGESAVLREVLARLDRWARGELPILIFGESGTGKELAARRVHAASERRGQPFEAVNCAALPEENLAQSELFGHVRGAFTGADRDRQGIFERARGGTVFLDEIGDLPPGVQGKLLRVLQEGEIRRLGESFVRQVDVRVIAATHRDLQRMVHDGAFRGDLYYRLKAAVVALPPLRERGDDLLLLADFLLDQNRRRRGLQAVALTLSAEAKARLHRHRWPGNVRELRNTLEAAALLADGREIRAGDLGLPDEEVIAPVGDYHRLVDQFKERLILDALAKSGGNRARAARLLGLTRQALSYHTRQLGLPREGAR